LSKTGGGPGNKVKRPFSIAMLNYQKVAIVDEAQHFGEIAEVASLFPAHVW